MSDKSIIICSFDRSAIFQLSSPQEIKPSDFIIHIKESQDIETSKSTYSNAFNVILEKIKSGEFDKVVLSKLKKSPYKQSPLSYFNKLNEKYKYSFNFLLSSPELGCWMGATPELLCDISDSTIGTVSLAGTKVANESWTQKELDEQAYVTDYITEALNEVGAKNIVTNGPITITAGPVEHLKTEISAELEAKKSWTTLISQLHPTPATCGIPTQKSLELISNTESHQRQLYTGFIGVFSDENKKSFVNLRCMQIHSKEVSIYVGGGITASSDLEKEWNETERKAKTLEEILK
jgi:isochorismate synthase